MGCVPRMPVNAAEAVARTGIPVMLAYGPKIMATTPTASTTPRR